MRFLIGMWIFIASYDVYWFFHIINDANEKGFEGKYIFALAVFFCLFMWASGNALKLLKEYLIINGSKRRS